MGHDPAGMGHDLFDRLIQAENGLCGLAIGAHAVEARVLLFERAGDIQQLSSDRAIVHGKTPY